MPKAKAQSKWQNRIVGHGEKPASEFKLNPNNWRTHPGPQQEALREILERIGWVTGVIENVTTGNLVDGHLRVSESLKSAPSTLIPFTQVELTEEEEKQILLLFDPLASMATADEDMLRGLLEMTGLESDVLLSVLRESDLLASIEPIQPNLEDPSFNYQSQFGVIVVCESEDHQQEVFNALSEQGYSVRVVVV
jgi:hypothetical protein